jgi:cell division protein FtsB
MNAPSIASVDQRVANQIGSLMIENARLSTVVEQANAVIEKLKEENAELKAKAAGAKTPVNDTPPLLDAAE